jgi:hypothetical protein
MRIAPHMHTTHTDVERLVSSVHLATRELT